MLLNPLLINKKNNSKYINVKLLIYFETANLLETTIWLSLLLLCPYNCQYKVCMEEHILGKSTGKVGKDILNLRYFSA